MSFKQIHFQQPTSLLTYFSRKIIEEASMEQLESRAAHKTGSPMRYLQSASPSAFYKLERRSLEAPQASNGDNMLLHQIGSASRPAA